MQQRTLGQQCLTVSAVGYGCMGISMADGPGDVAQGIAAIHRAHDLGVTFFDTAEIFGWGENERIVGRAVAGFRDDVVLAPVGGRPGPPAGGESFAQLVLRDGRLPGGDDRRISAACG